MGRSMGIMRKTKMMRISKMLISTKGRKAKTQREKITQNKRKVNQIHLVF